MVAAGIIYHAAAPCGASSAPNIGCRRTPPRTAGAALSDTLHC